MSKKKTNFNKKFFIWFFAGYALAAIYVLFIYSPDVARQKPAFSSKYGDFLAAQHAMYVNDFDKSVEFTKNLGDIEYKTVKNTRISAEFMAGKLPSNVQELAKEKSSPARLMYDAYLVTNEKWDDLYNRHIKDTSPFYEPMRIWSGVAKNRITEAIKHIDSLDTNSSWKAFMRGQIYSQTGKIDRAAKEFSSVAPDFMNLNDYIYIMSFYRAHNFNDLADKLRSEYTSDAAGLFMINYDDIPDWSVFTGIKNSMAFDILQTISHTKILLYTDISVLMLRFAQIVADETPFFKDSVNYFIGRFLYNTEGDYTKYFAAISKESPYYLFAQMRIAEQDNSIAEMKKILKQEPLFIFALNRVVAYHTQHGERRSALRALNRALRNEKITQKARAYLLEKRASVYLTFGDTEHAQKDLFAVRDLDIDNTKSVNFMFLQAKTWTKNQYDLDIAYDFTMNLIKNNPTEVSFWDLLGEIVLIREGHNAAMEIYERIGASAQECSSLFEHLGDRYSHIGNKIKARNAYQRAIDLSDDGLVIVSEIEKKLRKLK